MINDPLYISISILILAFTLWWMLTILKTIREQRILTSALLKAIKEIAKQQGVEINLQKIVNEVTEKIK